MIVTVPPSPGRRDLAPKTQTVQSSRAVGILEADTGLMREKTRAIQAGRGASRMVLPVEQVSTRAEQRSTKAEPVEQGSTRA